MQRRIKSAGTPPHSVSLIHGWRCEGDLRCVDTLRFRGTKCGRRTYTAHLFKERRHVKRFMAEYR